jgi:hypothetical protein
MTMASLSRREIRQRSAQLSALVRDWDPLGVMIDDDWPRDEYDWLVGPLLTHLQSGSNNEEVARYLRKQTEVHFGFVDDTDECTAMAERIRRWFDHGWCNFAQPVTIFLALLNEGVDVWRPVRARPLESGLFRIIGVEANTSAENWQFPEGAIVKCEHKQFADGTSGIIAVELSEVAG